MPVKRRSSISCTSSCWCYADDDGDIDDGEFWADVDDADIYNDFEDVNSEQFDHGEQNREGMVRDGEESSPSENNGLGSGHVINAGKEEEEQLIQAHSIVTLLSVLIAVWSYQYNIAHNALNALLQLLGLFFSLLSSICSSISFVVSFFPPLVYKLKCFLQLKDEFSKFVVCPKCHSLYKFEDCFEVIGSKKIPILCSYIAFQNTPINPGVFLVENAYYLK